MLSINAQKRVVFERDRCCQCGVCLASCKPAAFSHSIGKDGLLDIEIDPDKCTTCGLCVLICPSHQLPSDRVTQEQVRQAVGIQIAHAADPTVRHMASSGGIARTLLQKLLENQEVDAVYSLVYPPGDEAVASQEGVPGFATPTGREARGTWLTSPPPPNQIPCSLYRSIPWGLNLAERNREWKKVLLIGLPCQIKGAKLLLKYYLPKTEILTVAIFCRKQKAGGHTDCIKRMVGEPDVSTPNVFYRGLGWPGSSGVYKEGVVKTTTYFFHAKCWTVPACHSCGDCMAPLHADITLADPWGIDSAEDNEGGANLIFVWTEKGKAAMDGLDGRIHTRACDAQDAIKSADFNQIRAKIDAIPFYLGQEKSLPRRVKMHMRSLMTVLAEGELSLINPNSRFVQYQLRSRVLLAGAAKKGLALFSKKRRT